MSFTCPLWRIKILEELVKSYSSEKVFRHATQKIFSTVSSFRSFGSLANSKIERFALVYFSRFPLAIPPNSLTQKRDGRISRTKYSSSYPFETTGFILIRQSRSDSSQGGRFFNGKITLFNYFIPQKAINMTIFIVSRETPTIPLRLICQ